MTATATIDDYTRIFDAERHETYPVVDALEAELGFAVDRHRLEAAARVLACPLKAHAPNWQHGRVLYALTRAYMARTQVTFANVLDIGTAKGFSALCLLWALDDADCHGVVTSVDVLDPEARVRRNTVVEVDGLKTLAEIQADFPEAEGIRYYGMTGVAALKRSSDRIHVCFVDGKHSHEAVVMEAALLATRQEHGDLAIFDDAHMDGVQMAIESAEANYTFRFLSIRSGRAYAIGTRRV